VREFWISFESTDNVLTALFTDGLRTGAAFDEDAVIVFGYYLLEPSS
jgi:hypothetical protein